MASDTLGGRWELLTITLLAESIFREPDHADHSPSPAIQSLHCELRGLL